MDEYGIMVYCIKGHKKVRALLIPQITRAIGVVTSSIGSSACVRFGAWVMVPLQGAVFCCQMSMAVQPGCGCSCRVLRPPANMFCNLGSMLA